ncbi:MAG TPA: hypothetical protein VMX58_01685 [Patescibacteria group bacterium]|nr:hypothetical protein [Patescibacteria group bacterium]
MNDHISSDELSSGLKRRIIVLIVTSTMVVALTFGLSFYFALISNETAVAKQMPELESLAGTLKRILLINTLAFAAVIIASLYALSSLITARMFHPLESMMRDLLSIGKGTLPRQREPIRKEPFAGFEELFETVLATLQDREEREIEEIRQCISILSNENDASGEAGIEEIKRSLVKMLQEKGSFLGVNGEDIPGAEESTSEHDPLFMQPV